MPLLTWLFAVIAPLAVHLLKALGIGLVTFTGITILLDAAKATVFTQLGTTGTWAIAMLSLANMDLAINLIFSAMAARLVLQGMSGGSVTRWRQSKPT